VPDDTLSPYLRLTAPQDPVSKQPLFKSAAASSASGPVTGPGGGVR
jgi:hypothetical protein